VNRAAETTVPDVSVIVIAHDVRDEVLRCLESVRAHAGGTVVETLLVDNGSGDGTLDAVRATFPETRTVALERNEGMGARNYGLRLARGRYRMFLDSDAALTAGVLDDLVAFMDAHPHVGLVGPRLVYADGSLQHSARRIPPLSMPLLRRPPLGRWLEDGKLVRRHLMVDVPPTATRETEYVIGACQFFSAAAQAAAGEIDRRIPFGPDDIDWCVKIRRAGYLIAYRPEVTVIHAYRRKTAQRPFSRASLGHLYTFAYFFWKWRRHRRRLRAEGEAMERRGWELPAA
jgi:N-acetylglucosaminyl-diphospho-decaprenol L-rhamnosyltransferase